MTRGKVVALVVALALVAGVAAAMLRPRQGSDEPGGGVGGGGAPVPTASAPSASVTAQPVNDDDIAAPAVRYIVALNSFDATTPYPGWSPSSFDGILGGELRARQDERNLSATSPSVGDLDAYRLYSGRSQVNEAVVDSVQVDPLDGDSWLVSVEFHVNVTNTGLSGTRPGGAQFATITVDKVGDAFVAVSDERPQAP